MSQDPKIVPGPYRVTTAVVVSSTGRLMADSLHIQGFFADRGGQMDPVGFRPGDAIHMIRAVKAWVARFRGRSDVSNMMKNESLGVDLVIARIEELLAEPTDPQALAIAAAKLGVMLQWMAAWPMDIPAHNDRLRMQRLRSGYRRRYGDVHRKRTHYPPNCLD